MKQQQKVIFYTETVKDMENNDKNSVKPLIFEWLPFGTVTEISKRHNIDIATFKRALKADKPKAKYLDAVNEAFDVAILHKKKQEKLSGLKQQLQAAQ